MTKTCAECGREFETTREDRKYCSRACRHRRNMRERAKHSESRAKKRREASELGRAARLWAETDFEDALRRARERPEWCSPARWRMELGRRRRDAGLSLAVPDEYSVADGPPGDWD